MNTLIQKEIRLMLPAFAGTFIVTCLGVWLAPNYPIAGQWAFILGILLLGVTSFGREMAIGTFPFMLAQPVDRSRIWMAKILILAVCSFVFCGFWWVFAILESPGYLQRMMPIESFALIAATAVTLTMSAVWMTLLLRQGTAAFVLAYLIPILLMIIVTAIGANDWIRGLTAVLYSATAFYLGRRQFLFFQDTGRPGGVLTFGGKRSVAAVSGVREFGPWRALILKELKLQEFPLAGMVALFAVHLGVVLIRKLGAQNLSGATRLLLESFSLVWLVMPLAVGCQSVAEERQFGTLDGLLCLPYSRRRQFGVKLAIVFVLGGLLSATLMSSAEMIGKKIGAGGGFSFGNSLELSIIVIVFLAISLIGIYASTLTRSFVQALAVGVGICGALWMVLSLASQPTATTFFGRLLFPVLAIPTMAAALVWLAFGNFKRLLEAGRCCRINILVLTVTLSTIASTATVVYHRAWGAWEWFVPLEEPHGPPSLPVDRPVDFRGNWGGGLAAIFPDGRLWTDRVVYGVRPTMSGGYFAPGSNWVDVALLSEETVAVRSDGTLWVSKKPGWQDKLVQYGTETGWKSVSGWFHSSAVLLKTDGTVWIWGPDAFPPGKLITMVRKDSWAFGTNIYKGEYPGLRGAFKPVQLGSDADWNRMMHGIGSVYAWKRDGTAWGWRHREEWEKQRLVSLDGFRFKGGGSTGREIWVREDGSLWRLLHGASSIVDGKHAQFSEAVVPVQIGKDSDWTEASCNPELVALKKDGSVWRWNIKQAKPNEITSGEMQQSFEQPPERMGTNNDWVGVDYWNTQPVTLAADGTIWAWPGRIENWEGQDQAYERNFNSGEWLAPSKRPYKIENILAAHE